MDTVSWLGRGSSRPHSPIGLLASSALVCLACCVALALAPSVRGSVNYGRGVNGDGGVSSGRGVIAFTAGYAPRSFNEIYHLQSSYWRTSYCSSDSVGDGTGLPSNCNSWMSAQGVNPFVDWRTCGYCFARAVNEDDNHYIGWTLFAG
jgi:hypothetical protein